MVFDTPTRHKKLHFYGGKNSKLNFTWSLLDFESLRGAGSVSRLAVAGAAGSIPKELQNILIH